MAKSNFLLAIVSGVAVILQPVVVLAQPPLKLDTTKIEQVKPLQLNQSTNFNYDAYILGPGDSIQIEVLDLPELSGTFSIGPDGTMYLPRIRELYVEGLTIEEMRLFITDQFRNYVINPELYVRPIKYRPIRVFVGGEVKRPGYYTLSGLQGKINQNKGINPNKTENRGSPNLTLFPTLYDAIRKAQGITPYSDLSTVEVTRRNPLSSGGGRIRAELNFLSLITKGNETQNIRLFDGDVVSVSKSPTVLREQLLKAAQTNLSPQFFQVYVNGRVERPGAITLPQGSSLVQAIILAGGTKVMHGKVEFIRFTREGEIDRRIFGFKSDAPASDYRNPVLMAGDVIRLRDNTITKSLSVIDEFTTPVLGVYSVFSLVDGFSN